MTICSSEESFRMTYTVNGKEEMRIKTPVTVLESSSPSLNSSLHNSTLKESERAKAHQSGLTGTTQSSCYLHGGIVIFHRVYSPHIDDIVRCRFVLRANGMSSPSVVA